jgi:glycerol-3-phosphate dehydrogenase
MTDKALKVDAVVIGGGIGGLWIHNLLRRRGFSSVLLETQQLGGHQTLHSQGIIHGGLKYALGGSLSNESEAIAGMPDRWRACLRGQGELDLTGVRVLSDAQYLWSAGSMASRVTTFFASRMLRGRIHKLKPADFPSALRDKAFRGRVYQLDDLVVDAESLVQHLAGLDADSLLQFDPQRDQLHWHEQGLKAVEIAGTRIEPTWTVLAAGAGNDALLKQAHAHHLATDTASQARPLKMALVRHRLGHRLYAHCIGASNKPRLTVTTHDLADGSLLWYLGGDLAERGAEMDDEDFLALTRDELGRLFSWLDFSDADIQPLQIDRAEPRQNSLVKPDNAWAQRDRQLLITWPTKLTLAPDLGERVLSLLDQAGACPEHAQPAPQASVPRAQPGRSCWHERFGGDA